MAEVGGQASDLPQPLALPEAVLSQFDTPEGTPKVASRKVRMVEG